jgi:hypothetical protein
MLVASLNQFAKGASIQNQFKSITFQILYIDIETFRNIECFTLNLIYF